MIVTVTLNPSLDRTIEVGALERGQVQRVTTARLDPGGKGVNVARALLANGVPARAVVPIAGAEGDQLVGLLEKEGVDVAVVPIPGRTRSNTAIAEADGTVTKLNEPGPTLGASDLDALATQVLAALSQAALASGHSQVMLQVERANETAQRLYARCGFERAWTYRYWRVQ